LFAAYKRFTAGMESAGLVIKRLRNIGSTPDGMARRCSLRTWKDT